MSPIWSILLAVTGLLWALIPGRRGRSRQRTLGGLFVTNIALAIASLQTISGIVGMAMSGCFLAGAAWLLICDLRARRP